MLRCISDPTDERCNAFTQNCSEGFRCTVKADFSNTQCAMIDENAKGVGDVCVLNDSGIDNCEKGAYCSMVNAETLEGICAPLCVDSEPACPPQYVCEYKGGWLGYILAICVSI